MNRKATMQIIENPKSGRSSAEVLVVFLLFIVLGLTVFTLAASSSKAWKLMDSKREAMADARIAISFVMTKMRQNDMIGALHLEQNPLGNGLSLVITEVIQDAVYETWIYFDEGILREALVLSGEKVTHEVSFDIVSLNHFSMEVDNSGSGIIITANKIDTSGELQQLSSLYHVRSGGVR